MANESCPTFILAPKQPVLSPNVMSFLLTALLAGRAQKARHYQLVLMTRPVVALLIKCFIGIQSQLHPIRFSSSHALNVSHISHITAEFMTHVWN